MNKNYHKNNLKKQINKIMNKTNTYINQKVL